MYFFEVEFSYFLHFYVFLINFFRNADDAVIRPLPKAKRLLTDTACLPHIVQVTYCGYPQFHLTSRTFKKLSHCFFPALIDV